MRRRTASRPNAATGTGDICSNAAAIGVARDIKKREHRQLGAVIEQKEACGLGLLDLAGRADRRAERRAIGIVLRRRIKAAAGMGLHDRKYLARGEKTVIPFRDLAQAEMGAAAPYNAVGSGHRGGGGAHNERGGDSRGGEKFGEKRHR